MQFAALGKIGGLWYAVAHPDLLGADPIAQLGRGRRLTLAQQIAERALPFPTVHAAREAGRSHFERVYVEPITQSPSSARPQPVSGAVCAPVG
jgi:hypothetical protein